MLLPDVSDDELTELYAWVDTIPLSRLKRSIARDFADGVALAEVVYHYFPKFVQLHNYSPTSNAAQKVYNWETLNRKVFSKFFGFTLPKDAYTAAAFSEPGVIEKILKFVRSKLAEYQTKNGSKRALVSKSLDELQEHPEKGQWKVAASYAQRISPSYVPIKDGSPDEQENYETFHSPKSWENNYNDENQEGFLELQELYKTLEVKAAKMEQLLRLKDAKIAALTAKLQSAGLL